MKINRNDECWCNSGLKYKKCHMEFDEKLKSLKERGFEVPSHNIIKTKELYKHSLVTSTNLLASSLTFPIINILDASE